MEDNYGRFKLFMGFRILTLTFSFLLFSMHASLVNVVNHAIIITCLLIANVIVILMYRYGVNRFASAVLWGVETVGIFSILIFTGGINSFYFWVILNPMIVGLNTYERLYKIQHFILVFLVVGLFNYSNVGVMINVGAIERMQTIQMFFGMIMLAMYSYLTGVVLRDQQKSNTDLKQTQLILEETIEANQGLIDNIMESTELLEKITIAEEYDVVIEVFKTYLQINFGGERSFFITKQAEGYKVSDGFYFPYNETVEYMEKNAIGNRGELDVYQHHSESGEIIQFSKLEYKDNIHYFGSAVDKGREHSKEVALQQLQFIVKLHQIAVAKINLFQLKRELLIKDEQNRIAEEMHDNVNQQLFALSCHVFSLKNDLIEEPDINRLIDTTNLIYSTLQKTSHDLKDIIYRMSYEKGDCQNLHQDIHNYMDELAQLYHIEIECDLDDDIFHCNSKTQNEIFRVLNETIANAVKHGKAETVDVEIKTHGEQIHIKVQDDGIGISQFDLIKEGNGMGLSNLKRMAMTDEGYFKICSNHNGKGTLVEITL